MVAPRVLSRLERYLNLGTSFSPATPQSFTHHLIGSKRRLRDLSGSLLTCLPVLWTTRAATILGEAIVLTITLIKIRPRLFSHEAVRGYLELKQRRSITEVLLMNGMCSVL